MRSPTYRPSAWLRAALALTLALALPNAVHAQSPAKPAPAKPGEAPAAPAPAKPGEAPAAPAPAKPGEATSDEAAARAHYERGTAAYALGDFAEAARQYEAAFRLKLDPALLYNAAQAHRRANNRTRAIELYENLLRLFPSAPNREVARQHLDELKRGIGPAAPAPAASPVGTTRPAPAVAPTTAAATPPPATAPPPVTAAPPPSAVSLVPPPIPNLEPTGVAPVVAVKSEPVDRPPPLYKKPWFWGVVAGVVLVGVVTAVAVSLDDPAAKPSWGRVGEP